MRLILAARSAVLVLLVWTGPSLAQLAGSDPQALAAFAERLGLHDVPGFAQTVQALRDTGELPPRYATKDAARMHGWHGGGLCTVWPGHVIGGDRFNNFGGQLPDGRRVYREADLDADCRGRGPKRLIFSNDGLIFVTVDHYSTFTQVP